MKIFGVLEMEITKNAITPQVLGGFPPSWDGNTPTEADLESPLFRFVIRLVFAKLELFLCNFS